MKKQPREVKERGKGPVPQLEDKRKYMKAKEIKTH
jgi:hypothetical protein